MSLNTYSQSFNIDNLDSCKIFLCSKVWITRFSNEPTMRAYFSNEPRKYEKPKASHELDPIVAKITFYKNQTFKINYNTIEETGKWYFDGTATSLSNDTINDNIEIGWEVHRPRLTIGDSFILIDATKTKRVQCKSCAYLPVVPYFYRKTNGAKAYEGYYVQE